MKELVYQLGNYKIFREVHQEIHHDLLYEFNTALKLLDKNKYNYDSADYERRRNKIIDLAAEFYAKLVS